ncbi:MAG TPA: hypothetical protein VGQ73_04345 [Gemmatimonadales bacterium]|jgi:hypothetical protein|nr:hypothetical protein [Gemmatimonadales bacterium]
MATKPATAEPVVDEVAAAKARLVALDAVALAAEEAEVARRRDQQIVLKAEASELLEKLAPVRAALLRWDAAAPPNRLLVGDRTFSTILLGQLAPVIQHAGSLQSLVGAERELTAIIAECGGPVLAADRLAACFRRLEELDLRVHGIPRLLSAHRSLAEAAIETLESARQVIDQHVTWFRSTEAAHE